MEPNRTRQFMTNVEAGMMTGKKFPIKELKEYMRVKRHEFNLDDDPSERVWLHKSSGKVYLVVGLGLRCVDDPTITTGASRLELMVWYAAVDDEKTGISVIAHNDVLFGRTVEAFLQKFTRAQRTVTWGPFQ